jgi:hypothetical protein
MVKSLVEALFTYSVALPLPEPTEFIPSALLITMNQRDIKGVPSAAKFIQFSLD